MLKISNINIIDTESGLLRRNMDVFIDDDRIKKVSLHTKENLPDEIDGTNKFILPGLFDMHAHTSTARYLPLFLLNGVTSIRDVGNHLDSIYDLKVTSRKPDAIIPKLYIAGPIIEGDPSYWGAAFRIVRTKEEVKAAVDELTCKGVDFIKCYHTLSLDLYKTLLSCAKENNLKVTGHLPKDVTAQDAYSMGQSCIEHMFDIRNSCFDMSIESPGPDYDKKDWAKFAFIINKGKTDRLLDIMKSRNAAICPTLILNRQGLALRNYDKAVKNTFGYEYMSDTTTKNYWAKEKVAGHRELYYENYERMVDAAESIVKPLYENSLMLAGTDSANPLVVPGFSLVDELVTMVACGLTPMEALKTATINPAIYLERLDTGRVCIDSVADLVIYDSNPLDDMEHLRKPMTVILNGVVYNRSALEKKALLCRTQPYSKGELASLKSS